MNQRPTSAGSLIARHTRSIGCGKTRTYSMVQRSRKRTFSISATAFPPFFHLVQMIFECVEALVQQINLPAHPSLRVLQLLRFELVDARLRLGAETDDAAIAQHL